MPVVWQSMSFVRIIRADKRTGALRSLTTCIRIPKRALKSIRRPRLLTNGLAPDLHPPRPNPHMPDEDPINTERIKEDNDCAINRIRSFMKPTGQLPDRKNDQSDETEVADPANNS